ncbi:MULTISPECIES: exodeoxyribonuclease V subunit beta [unclassified Pseudoxanthomonas]|uniref:exodeoxyribonuclease V subunit beta n=1 Tax=unclassified Pseudoxanthomonas TaxID=2645906 RepID=UPI003076D01E
MSDAVFDTDLHARSLVEASAGTGKTYALAGLFARAVIVDRLRVPQILAVTYTVAATQELRERVRLRLRQAVELADTWKDCDPETREGDAPETAMLRRLLHQALLSEPRESLPALRQRLARALREMDLAAIATIHGFCQRVLREHALDTRQPLIASELETADTAARERLAADLWRAFSRDTEGADFLHRQFGRVEDISRALRDLLAPEPLLPPPPPALVDPRPALAHAWRQVCESFTVHGEPACEVVGRAIADAVLKANEYKADHVVSLWQWLRKAVASPNPPSAVHPKLHKYLPAVLEKGTLKAKAGKTPQSPLFATFEPVIDTLTAVEHWQEARDLQRLHALRADALRRERVRKEAFNVRDYDDLIGELHAAVADERASANLIGALREQFPCVLVDEFQDTDARQWNIFARLFGDGSLVLVGDPKQAIYRFRGGDVNTYVAAAGTAQQGATLDRNFRSRPSVIRAVNTLFESAPPGALGEGIDFLPTHPGGNAADMDFLLDGQAAPAIHFHVVPPTDTGKDYTKPVSVHMAAELCADAILQRLQQAQAGRALIKDRLSKSMRPLQPRDVAVLVRDHRQATAVRHALSLRGVPAVASGRESLYQSEEAQDLLTLLLALRAPGDDRRLRAALATPLLGWDAAHIAVLDEEGDLLRQWQQSLVSWRSRWERHGLQAMLAEVLAANAERLLGQAGGERRLTNYLQLGELMQSAAGRNLGTQGQLDALRYDIVHADGDDEAQQPRLESDAGRVQILTLHKSKGLEFPLVYLPFVGIGRQEKLNGLAMYTDASGQRVRQWPTTQTFDGAPAWNDAKQAHLDEESAEDMRLLYVGLTRASEALWLCCGPLSQHRNASLHRLLQAPGPAPKTLDALGNAAVISSGLPPMERPPRLPAAPVLAVPEPRIAQRRLHRDWWIHSFSQLHKQQPHGASAMIEARPADDEAPSATAPPRPRQFGGARFGNTLHHALERVDFAAWCGHVSELPPHGQIQPLIDALNSQGYPEKQHEAGIHELTPLIASTLNTPMPEGVRLCDLPPEARIAELEFHLALRGATTQAFLDLLHRYGLAMDRHDFGVWTQLTGLLNGKIDLTYRHAGRVYVMDYKSNDLPSYDPDALAQTMASSEYDLQALLYTLAVHRWMQLRLGGKYDYDRDFGGVRYVFCRGLDVIDPARGVFVPQFPRALVEAVDALLVPPLEAAA